LLTNRDGLAAMAGVGERDRMWDTMKSTAIRQGLNMFLKSGYGEITALEFDSKARSLQMQLLLHGEESPIDIAIDHFEAEMDGEDLAVVLTGVRVSRAWMQELVRSRVEGKRFPVPAAFAGMAKLVLS